MEQSITADQQVSDATSILAPVDEGDLVDQSPSGARLVDQGDGTLITSVGRDAGESIQTLILLEDHESPTEVSFDIEGTPTVNNADVLSIKTSDGQEWFVAPPWARDAAGVAVPTHFEVRGTKLVQVIAHTKHSYSYPIVADPFLGKRLFSQISRDTYQGDLRYNGFPSAWGVAVWSGAAGGVAGAAAGQAIFRKNGWDEWKAAFPAVKNMATLQQQYNCHVLGAPFAGEWNIERFRVNNPNWIKGVETHRCNW